MKERLDLVCYIADCTCDFMNRTLDAVCDTINLDARIHDLLDTLDIDDVNALAKAGTQIRQWILDGDFPAQLDADIRSAFAAMANGNENMAVAVRSSATAEDLPDASFAGQQETFSVP